MPTESLLQAIERVQNLHQPSYKDRATYTFALVTECTLPRRTRGTDFVVNLTLTDESQQDENGNYEQVELIVFSKTVEDMPQARLGDIIELRSVLVQFWQPPAGGARRPQLFGKMSQPHTFGFLLYHQAAPLSQDPAAAVQPYQAYNADSLGGPATAARLAALRGLSSRLGAQPVQDAAQTYLRKIRDLDAPRQPGDRPEVVDIKVQVLAVDTRNQGEEVVMFVWDGTDAKPQPADLRMPPSCWKGQELRVTHTKRRSMPLHPQPPQLLLLPELPHLGTVLPVVMDAAAVPPAGLPEVGQWVKVRVAGLMVVQGQMQLVFARCSNLSVLQAPPSGWQEWYQSRVASSQASEWPLDAANLVATCSRADLQPHCTIRQVQLKLLQGDTGPFRVQLRLVGHCPQDLRHWCVPVRRRAAAAAPVAAAAAAAFGEQQQQWEWAVHLMLEDATGTLRALLVSHEGSRLLGLPPTDLGSSDDDVQQLRQLVEHLSSVDADGGVWMDVALTAVPIPGRAVLPPPPPQQQQQEEAEQELNQQQQQQQPQQQGAVDIASQFRFILHDAVCRHVQQQEAALQLQQEARQLSHNQQQQQLPVQHGQQQLPLQEQQGVPADVPPSAKRQCVALEHQHQRRQQPQQVLQASQETSLLQQQCEVV